MATVGTAGSQQSLICVIAVFLPAREVHWEGLLGRGRPGGKPHSVGHSRTLQETSTSRGDFCHDGVTLKHPTSRGKLKEKPGTFLWASRKIEIENIIKCPELVTIDREMNFHSLHWDHPKRYTNGGKRDKLLQDVFFEIAFLHHNSVWEGCEYLRPLNTVDPAYSDTLVVEWDRLQTFS